MTRWTRSGVLAALGLCLLAGCAEGEAEAEMRADSLQDQAQQDALPEEAEGAKAPEEVKVAECMLWPGEYRGPCLFDPRGRGSFSITREDGEAFYDEIVEVMVFVWGEGKADVRARKAGGGNDLWGEAERSEGYPACWIGEEFSVCAY